MPTHNAKSASRLEEPVDWERVERWSSQIAERGESNVVTEFTAEYGRDASLIWDPSPDRLSSEALQFLLAYWSRLRAGDSLPRPADIDPLEMRPALGYVALVDPVEDGRDFRYRLYGSMLASISNVDMTGKLLSALKATRQVREFSLATYRAAFQRKRPIYVVRSPDGAAYTAQWLRLTLPLVDDGGKVARFLSGIVPLTSSGRPLIARL